eukprot:NODE_846_length_3739_cov_0.148626.p2 type:complete len:237 gc:universal NODE_846_length_3739_cov_0.148626:3407-2697(-)
MIYSRKQSSFSDSSLITPRNKIDTSYYLQSTQMSIVDQLSEEMEALESIYTEEFVRIDELNYHIRLNTEHITIFVNVSNTKELIPNIHFSDKVVKFIPPNITESLPRGVEWNEFKEEEVQELMQVVNDEKVSDSVVVFGIVSAVQDEIERLFEKKYKQRHDKPSMELTEAQLKGTKVTKQSFEKWWSNFKSKVAVEPKKSTKLTGKQLFEQGAVAFKEFDEVADGVDVDYSLFENE